MSRIFGILVLLVTGLLAWQWYGHQAETIKGKAHVNRLSKEKSPYLLQHQHNPVDWYPWGNEAFEKARRENKPIFLSIGYSTCHWCHVMEHDSFEKQDVADFLNRHFVSIKLDREERPDIDQIYMDAVVSMTGRGGWPLSLFLTPDLKPFFGGTFFWKDQFLGLLGQIQNAWTTQPDQLTQAGNEMVAHLQGQSVSAAPGSLNFETIKQAADLFHTNYDPVYGGFGGAPKFPRSYDLSFLLRVYHRDPHPDVLQMVRRTLDSMARGGIYDHLGGGFHRYSTDARWLVPHFEKMLYDNALLAVTYLEGFQVTGEKMYVSVAQEILDYVLRDMTNPEGGFYSAEDADSEGEEGKYYVWTEKELKKILSSSEYALFQKVYGITEHGNFDGTVFAQGEEHDTSILSLSKDFSWDIKQDPLIRSAHQKLLEVRSKRIPPLKDDKILTSWNGLMIAAMAKGYQVLGDERYLAAAQKAASFIESHLIREGKLLRRYRDGDARFEASVDDYSYLIHGLLSLFQTDFDSRWFELAKNLQAKQDELFCDEKNGGYFFAASGTSDLVVRNKEIHDGAVPSGNSVSVSNLLALYGLTGEKSYRDHAEKTLQWVAPFIRRYPPGFAMMLTGLDGFLNLLREIVVIGSRTDPQVRDFLDFLNREFIPNKVVVWGDGLDVGTAKSPPLLQNRGLINGQPAVYICEGTVCREPLTNFEKAKEILHK